MSIEMIRQILVATGETVYMVIISGILATFFGLPLGVLLTTTHQGGVLQQTTLNKVMAAMINAARSIPFIILLVAIIPFTRFVIGTSIGTTAAVVPLTVGAIPFVARIVELALEEVSPGLIEAGLAMGATPLQIIKKIMLPEAMSGIINGITVTMVTLVGYSSMAGVIGGGGLGDLAIRYGYQRFDANMMLITVVLLILMVQLIQMLGDRLASRY